jgi:hypothetical protein
MFCSTDIVVEEQKYTRWLTFDVIGLYSLHGVNYIEKSFKCKEI